jgi:hypothetical protein
MTNPMAAASAAPPLPGPWTELRRRLDSIPAGPVPTPVATALLRRAERGELLRAPGRDTALRWFAVLHGADWCPPMLTLRAAPPPEVSGIDTWRLDLSSGAVTLTTEQRPHPSLSPIRPRLRLAPIAEDLVAAILERRREPRLEWSRLGRVRVRMREALPPAGSWTTRSRRKRVHLLVSRSLEARGWRSTALHWIEPPELLATSVRSSPDVAARVIAACILCCAADPRLQWASDRGRVRLKVGVLFGGMGRRRRKAIEDELTDHLRGLLGSQRWVLGDDGWWERGLPGGAVGWLCWWRWSGRFVLCFSCGSTRPQVDPGRSGSVLLTIDEVRPHPQRCRRCHRTVVEGILPTLPERY